MLNKLDKKTSHERNDFGLFLSFLVLDKFSNQS